MHARFYATQIVQDVDSVINNLEEHLCHAFLRTWRRTRCTGRFSTSIESSHPISFDSASAAATVKTTSQNKWVLLDMTDGDNDAEANKDVKRCRTNWVGNFFTFMNLLANSSTVRHAMSSTNQSNLEKTLRALKIGEPWETGGWELRCYFDNSSSVYGMSKKHLGHILKWEFQHHYLRTSIW